MDETKLDKDVFKEWLLEKSIIFKELTAVKKMGWENPKGDEHFVKQRRNADSAAQKPRAQRFFFDMMRGIGDQIQYDTGALSIANAYPQALDLCMAPGGFTASFLKYNPQGAVVGLSLPPELGGHPVVVKNGSADARVSVTFLDITMMCPLPASIVLKTPHPDSSKFMFELQSLAGKSFDIVFADGQVLRTHHRPEHREHREPARLLLSQIILGMNYLKKGGTIMMLLHKVDGTHAARLLFMFSKFASVKLFKPKKSHATRSSFYMIAQCVNTQSSAAQAAVSAWKDAWQQATFENTEKASNLEEVDDLIADFGDRLVEMAEPIWQIQLNALLKAPYNRP